MLFEVKSERSLAEIDRALRDATARHRFGILGVHDLKAKMKEKGVEFDNDCLVYEVCNPQQAKTVLEKNGAVSTALPCRISVYGEGGGYKLATILPTAMLALFHSPALDPVAREVENEIVAIMNESA
jgi:uncharacterized protein (DUF302 family)